MNTTMKKLLIALALVSQCSIAQNVDWIRTIGGSENDAPKIVTTDVDNNIYTLGDFQGEMYFDPGTASFTLTSNGRDDFYVQKLDGDGNFIWGKSVGGSSADIAWSLNLDVDDNIYATGYFFETTDFDPGDGTYNLSSNGFSDAFVIKLNKSILGSSDVANELVCCLSKSHQWSTHCGIGPNRGPDKNKSIQCSGSIGRQSKYGTSQGI
jgi:hypothetical protein